MAVISILRILLIAAITRCRCEPPITNPLSQFGEILKPPPPPLNKILPVPFHGGVTRNQRQNIDVGYHYQPPPPPPPPPPTSDFKFPAPFYKQYNFNFLPQPQPFTTTPSPSLFQKVSGWLFSSKQNNYNAPIYNSNNIAPVKKDCNSCNLVPWIPVIRYNVGAKNLQQQNLIPTYGPPSPTAYAQNFQNVAQYYPQPFQNQNQNQKLPQLSQGVPHAVYGPPVQSFESSSVSFPSSTYGPPSPTHTLAFTSNSALSSTYSVESSSSSIPKSTYGVPSSSIYQPSSSYGVPSSSYGVPSSSYGLPVSSFGMQSTTYSPPTSTFATFSPNFDTPQSVTSSYEYPSTSIYDNSVLNNDIEFPSSELQLPKVTHPSGFKNSYGEPIANSHALDIPYPLSATGAESTKVEILPQDGKKASTPNMSLALANPAPFKLNRGRNIHTLQPVALPNLSVSPLPPIFNARPFRPLPAHTIGINTNLIHGLNYMQHYSKNVDIEQSVPLAEYTQSVEYPPTIIKTPIIDIEPTENLNQSKGYRNIENEFILNGFRDISSQASEDHLSATKTGQDSSFESTGADFGNDLYDTILPADLKKLHPDIPSNHKAGFADLRGVEDIDVDKYRTENNLQNIDSPLLYLKPSAPHKDHSNFVLTGSTTNGLSEYEIYDDIPTTSVPQHSTLTSSWDESRTDYSDGSYSLPSSQGEENKPNIVQIIVPYTTGQHNQNSNKPQSWTSSPENEYQGRKVPSNPTENNENTINVGYSTVSTTTEDSLFGVTDSLDSEKFNTQAILNDLYDVKEPPFDIIKLQHTIDDWTEQEYSKHYKFPHMSRTSAKYAKQIPDEYFTTISPINNDITSTSYENYDFYDHEGAGSVQHSLIDKENQTIGKPFKQYNNIERVKSKYTNVKNEDSDEGKQPHIYTAASSFRITTTTPPPWGKIQTSISPLTKEKIYVVTAKPWKESQSQPLTEKKNEWFDVESFESQKTGADNDVSASDSLPFKSPRFSNRPSFGFTATGEGHIQSLKSDSSYTFSKKWLQSINDLESKSRNSTTFGGPKEQYITTNSPNEDTEPNMAEDTTTTTTAEPLDILKNIKTS